MTSRPGQARWHAGDTGDTLPGQAAPSEKLPTTPLAPDTAECWDKSPVPSGTARPGLRSRGPVPCSRGVPRALQPCPPGLEAAPSPCAPLRAGTASRKLAAVFLSTLGPAPRCDGRARGLEETLPCCRGSWLAQLLQGPCLQPGDPACIPQHCTAHAQPPERSDIAPKVSRSFKLLPGISQPKLV